MAYKCKICGMDYLIEEFKNRHEKLCEEKRIAETKHKEKYKGKGRIK